MAAPRRVGNRVYALPSRRTGRPRFYYDTERRAFYNVPSRGVRSKRLDVRRLLADPETSRNFRVRTNGRYSFRGTDIGMQAAEIPERRLLPRTTRRPQRGVGGKPVGYPYFERIRAKNPTYEVVNVFEREDGVTAVFVGDNGVSFTVTTSPERARQ